MFVTHMPCLYVLLCGPKIHNKDSCILYSFTIIFMQERKRSVDTDEATISSTGLHITDKDAKLVGKKLFS